jgi:hypothetical protein
MRQNDSQPSVMQCIVSQQIGEFWLRNTGFDLRHRAAQRKAAATMLEVIFTSGCQLSGGIIDANNTHFVDLMVDVDTTTVGGTRNRQSVVMIRNVTRIDADDEYL